MFNMSTEDKLKNVSPTFGNTVLPAVVGSQTKYQIVYADPAWKMGYVKGGLTAGSVKGGEELPYQTMTDDEIMAMPIKDIADDNAFLFMWVTDNRIPKVAQFMEAWGFKYNSLAFVWNKISKYKEGLVRTTLTPYTRRSCEYCFMGTRGKTKDLVQDHYVLQYVAWASQTRKHSVKPDEVRQRIVQLCGDIPRIELFAREQKSGWDVWGNEVDGSVNLETSANNGR